MRPGHNALKDWEKWTVSRESWDEPLYPKCCYGPAYVLSPRAVIGIVKAYEKTLIHFSKFEDIYITGKKVVPLTLVENKHSHYKRPQYFFKSPTAFDRLEFQPNSDLILFKNDH